MKRLHIRTILLVAAPLLLGGIAHFSNIAYARDVAGRCGLAAGQSACFEGDQRSPDVKKCDAGTLSGYTITNTGGGDVCTWTCKGIGGPIDEDCSASNGGMGRLCGAQNGTTTDPGIGVEGKCAYGIYGGLTTFTDPWTWGCAPVTGEQSTLLCTAGANCSREQTYPVGCDLSDVGIAGVCYTPGSFGSVLEVVNGKVGINNSTPEYPLDVNGVIRAAQVYTVSDARLKSSIEKIDGALAKISQINGYQFTWKKDGRADMGVLAQEIEKVFTYAVQTDKDGVKTVQYTALIAPIIDAIHELNNLADEQSQKAISQSEHIMQLEKISK